MPWAFIAVCLFVETYYAFSQMSAGDAIWRDGGGNHPGHCRLLWNQPFSVVWHCVPVALEKYERTHSSAPYGKCVTVTVFRVVVGQIGLIKSSRFWHFPCAAILVILNPFFMHFLPRHYVEFWNRHRIYTALWFKKSSNGVSTEI